MKSISKVMITFVCLISIEGYAETKQVDLPKPDTQGKTTIEQTLNTRRSIREFKNEALTMQQISQLLWAGQGITSPTGFRTAPSAGATYPLELYVATKDGVFHYLPQGHKLEEVKNKDVKVELALAAYGQRCVKEAPLSIIITADYEKIRSRYGKSAERYVALEAGHIAENILLQAVALKLGGVPVGAFTEGEAKKILNLPANLDPIYIISVGIPR